MVDKATYESVFPRWSTAWCRLDEGMAELHANTLRLLGRRNKGVCGYPRLELQPYLRRLLEFETVSSRLAEGEPWTRAERRRVIRAALGVVPVIRAGLWTRWLDLEAALSQCFAEDDLLAAALLLRTLAEEVVRGRLLARACNGLEGKPVLVDHSAEGLRRLCNGLWDFGLPRLRPRSQGTLASGGCLADLGEADAALADVFRTLSDYVHPNYGSHQIVVRPVQSQVGRVLLESVVRIYTEFFERPWLAEDLRFGSRCPDVAQGDTSMRSVMERMRGHAGSHNPADLDALRDLTKYVDHCDDEVVVDDGSPSTEPLASIATALGIEHRVGSNLLGPVSGWPGPLEKPRQRWQWLLVTRLARQLEQRVATQATAPTRIRVALDYFTSLAELKAEQLTARALRFVAADLGLAAAVCARSVFEHHAVAVWLAKKTEQHVEAFARRQRIDELGKLEKQIARALAGTKSSRERPNVWKETWDRIFGRQAINLMEVAKSMGPGAAAHYDYLSGVVHGFAVTGADLLGGTAASAVRLQLCLRATVVLGICNSFESSLDRVAVLAYQKVRWVEEELTGGESPAESARKLLLPGKLHSGRDVFGRGTEAEPYVFRDGLNYYEAFRRFLAERSLAGRRRAWEHGGDVVETDDGRTFYFRAKPWADFGLGGENDVE